MSTKDASLYGKPRPSKKSSGKEISSSGTLAFTSQLSSLISSGNTQTTRASSGRAKSAKEDIFSAHNRGTKKRALKDLESDAPSFQQKHTTNGEPLDAAVWHRSKRRMEEKARLYAAMKRGDVEDDDGRHMVDFDRKWAQTERDGADAAEDHGDSDSDVSETAYEEVEWVDEFGRTRKGTRVEMAREQRQLQLQDQLQDRVRPSAPANVIYGDTVQAHAFDLDTDAADRMAALAAKRDRSLTPPPDTHFDASKEVRTKGVGFMQFSHSTEEREQQMRNLEAERSESVGVRSERSE